MNHQDCATVIADLKRPGLWSATNALLPVLALMLALSLTGQAVLAGEPIPGVDVELGKNPGGIIVRAPTGPDGTFDFKGLVPGNYDLSIAGKFVKTLSVGSGRSVSGLLSQEPGDTASISVKGLGAPIPLGGRPVASGEHIKDRPSRTAASSANAPGMAVVRPAEFKTAGEAPQKGGFKVAENESPTPTTRGINVAAGDLNGDGRADSRTASPGKKDGEVGPAVPSGNRDHIDQDAQTDIKKAKNGFSLPTTRASNPIPGVDIIVRKKPSGHAISAPTGPNGAFEFKGLEAGAYDLTVGGRSGPSLIVGTDGVVGGSLMRAPDGTVSIFDRWGNSMVGINGTPSDVSTTRLKTQGDTGARQPGQGGSGAAPAVTSTAPDGEKDKEKSTAAERFVGRGVSGFGSGAGSGGMTPPNSGVMAPRPGSMSPGPMGPGAMGGGAARK